MKLNLSYEQLDNEYSMLMSVLGASVSKHLLDEHFTCIWANDYYYELIRYSKTEYEARFHNHCDEYFHNNPKGWKQLVEMVTSRMAQQQKGGTAYLPMVYPDGERFWIKLQAVFMDEYIDGYQVSYTTMTNITEMMQAKQEQEHTREVFEKIAHEQDMLMSALKVSVSKHLIDEHFTCVRANDYYYKLIGYDKDRYETLFHNHPDEYYSNNPEGWEMLAHKVMETLERGLDQYELIVPMKYEDGSSYWVKLFSYFTDEYIDGIRTSYTVMTDVTELVQVKNEQEILMRAMKVSVSRHLVDEHFTVVWANNFYYELIGYSKPEYEALFHNRCDEYFYNNWDSWMKINAKVQEMEAAGDNSYEIFVPLKTPEGATCWVKMVGFFTDEYQDGKQVAYTTMVNVTDLMEAQQEKTIAYDNLPGFIVKYRILPDRFQIIDASDRIRDVFDIDMDHLTEADPLVVLMQESRKVILEQHPCFRTGNAYEGTIGARDKFGKDRWFRIHSTCIDFIAADPIYLTVFIDITDITELRELQSKLEERTKMLHTALEEAKKANAAKSDFLSRMSHDIRTPMNVIAGMTEIADRHLAEPERIRDCLQKIRLSSHHLLGLINDVLDMSKIENGNFPIHMSPISLPEVLREVIMITLAGVRERRQIFDVHLIHLRQERFSCDALRLRQILLNLLSNASKFTQRGGRITFDVEQLSSEVQGRAMLRFTVSDTGVGMKEGFQEHIFDAFTRENDSRIDRIEGSGLGMAITKRLVDLLAGSITVKSRLGDGTTFCVTLPVEPEAEVRTGAVENDACVLLIDGDPVTRESGCQALRALGAVAECTGDSGEAVAMVLERRRRRQDYTLILAGWDQSQPAGLEAAKAIRTAVPEDRPRMVLFTYDWNEIKDEALAAGIDGFIEKPLFRSTLRECLNEYVRGQVKSEHHKVVCDFSHKMFLLVEDNALNREIATELLGNMGASLEAAVNGREAVSCFQDREPGYYDLILMDIQMPVMDGYEAARAIRSLPRKDAKTVPIIAMTADAFVEDIQNAMDAGMNGHMAKPLDFETLACEISRYLKECQEKYNEVRSEDDAVDGQII